MRPSGDFYFVNAFLTLKNEAISLEDRHRLALFAWSCEQVFMPPNKRRQLLNWVQDALLKEPSLDLWLTFKHFLSNLQKIDEFSDFVPHFKLATAFKTALESDNQELIECCVDCLKLCSSALSRMPEQSLHWIVSKLISLGKRRDLIEKIVEQAFFRSTTENELETVVKRFANLPADMDDVQLRSLLCHRIEHVLNVLFQHNSRLLPLLCRRNSSLIAKVASAAASRSKLTEGWWSDFLRCSAAVKVSPHMTDLLKAVKAYPKLGSLVVQVNPAIFYSLPSELQADDHVQREFVANSDDITVDQLVTMDGLFGGPLSIEALTVKASKSDKLAVIQAMEKCKPELLEPLIRQSNLSNICFIPAVRDRVLRILEPVAENSVLITKICMMLNSKVKIESSTAIQLSVFRGQRLSNEECRQLWNQASTIKDKEEILHMLLYFADDPEVRTEIISDCAIIYCLEGNTFRLDAFSRIEDVTLFVKKFLHRIKNHQIAHHFQVIEKVSQCVLPAKIALKILSKAAPSLSADCLVRLARSALAQDDAVYEVVSILQNAGVASLTIAQLLSHCVKTLPTLLTSLGELLPVDTIFATIALSDLSERQTNKELARLAESNSADSLRRILFDLLVHAGYANLTGFLNKLDDRFRHELSDTSLDLFLPTTQSRLDRGLVNSKIIEECLHKPTPDIHLVRILTSRHQDSLQLPAKQSLLCALPRFDADLVIHVLRAFEENWRSMPSAVCLACTPVLLSLLSSRNYNEAHRVVVALVQVMRDPGEAPDASVPLGITLLHILTHEQYGDASQSDVRNIIFSLMAKCNRKLLAHAVSCAYGLNKNKEIARTINQFFGEFKETGRYDLKV